MDVIGWLAMTRFVRILATLLSIVAVGALFAQPTQQIVARVDTFGDPLPVGAVMRLGAMRFRFGGGLADIRFSPDGKMIVAHVPSDIYVWDAATGKELRRFHVKAPKMNLGMDISPDSRTLAIAEHNRE